MTQDALATVVYTSTATQPFDSSALSDLLRQSRANNFAADLTGMLLYRGGRFIQVLEGPSAVIDDLMATIGQDSRHADMRVLLREPIAERSFGDWTMGYEPIGVPAGDAPEGFRDTFDDLESGDESTVARAVRELTVWFRVRRQGVPETPPS
ncbi:BLUF domain-containing protein [Microbacterium enclense]|uniref:BLUF domain-containing protein n=1 Tax=Microbacterium enclense TaxID=993073 RepID=UPI0036DAD50B